MCHLDTRVIYPTTARIARVRARTAKNTPLATHHATTRMVPAVAHAPTIARRLPIGRWWGRVISPHPYVGMGGWLSSVAEHRQLEALPHLPFP